MLCEVVTRSRPTGPWRFASSGSVRLCCLEALAEMPVPDDVAVRPVRACGVPSLIVGDEPALLYVHGGGFVLGSAYGYRPLVAGVVAAAGVGALVPDFRLAPEHPYPAALDDVVAAYQWPAGRSALSDIRSSPTSNR
jgi:acetyl esterase/lipase